jgi:predicted RNA-binding Zn ribbon-like protein
MSGARPLPHRISGNIALDLANTISWRGTLRETDHLADADAIIAWAIDAGLVDAERVLPDDARDVLVVEVHRLRAAIASVGAAIAGQSWPDERALAVIRDDAARSLAMGSLRGAPAELIFAPGDLIIGSVAWAAFDLLRGSELDRLKQCPPEDCRWLFLDRSKNGSRRWCEMATCGNRAKARRHDEARHSRSD